VNGYQNPNTNSPSLESIKRILAFVGVKYVGHAMFPQGEQILFNTRYTTLSVWAADFSLASVSLVVRESNLLFEGSENLRVRRNGRDFLIPAGAL